MSFEQQLQEGVYGEDLISRWLISRGCQILPAYQIEHSHGKGPRFFGKFGQLICPDLLVFKSEKILWIEAKTKSAFTWHRSSSSWQTGIDFRHWNDYVRVADESHLPVWLLFLHKPGSLAKDTPDGFTSPSGLYGNSLQKLQSSIHHTHSNHGPSGMVYWTELSLIKLCPWEEIA